MKQEIEELKKKIEDLEYKYLFNEDYNFVCTLLNKLNVEVVELTEDEIKSNETMFILDRTEEGKTRIIKY